MKILFVVVIEWYENVIGLLENIYWVKLELNWFYIYGNDNFFKTHASKRRENKFVGLYLYYHRNYYSTSLHVWYTSSMHQIRNAFLKTRHDGIQLQNLMAFLSCLYFYLDVSTALIAQQLW